MDISRRTLGELCAGGLIAGTAGLKTAGAAGPQPSGELGSILDHLGALDSAVETLAYTWHPEDPAYRADLYRQIMMNQTSETRRPAHSSTC